MNTISIEGGCLCGAVRYSISCAPSVVLNCHCADCRKASGAPFVTWAVFPRDALNWTANRPRRVLWADRLRLFCPECGTSLGILPGERADIIVVSVGSMDHAVRIEPECHAWIQDKLPWIHLADGLPHHATAIGTEPVAEAVTHL